MGKLIHGKGINDADYVTQVFEDVAGSYSYRKSKRKSVWVCPYYRKWRGMLERCYSSKCQVKRTTYVGCSVCEEWLLFSNFKAWMQTQDWEGKHLDKDILYIGNKVYSPITCVFITKEINIFLTDSGKTRGDTLIGCSNVRGRFKAMCSNPISKKQEYIGYFDTEMEAHLAWKQRKHEYACILAESSLVSDTMVQKALVSIYKNYTILEDHIK